MTFSDTHAVVVSGASPLHAGASTCIAPNAVIIAADSGWDRAREAGLQPTILVGDMDSVHTESLREARAAGATIIEHPVDKDFTDIELALAHAATLARHVTLLSGGGGRLDHALSELAVLTADSLRDCTVDAVIGRARVHVIRGGEKVSVATTPGATLSLVAVGPTARGITLNGCKWNLERADLSANESRGISNVAVLAEVSVQVEDGHIAVVEPFFLVDKAQIASEDE